MLTEKKPAVSCDGGKSTTEPLSLTETRLSIFEGTGDSSSKLKSPHYMSANGFSVALGKSDLSALVDNTEL